MSLSDKYLAKAWPAVTKLVTLGLVGLSVGTPLGRTGYLRKVPFYLVALGSGGAGRLVSPRGTEP